MTPVTKKTSSQGGLARSAKYLSRTSPQTARAIKRYYTHEQERGRKIPRPIATSSKTSASI